MKPRLLTPVLALALAVAPALAASGQGGPGLSRPAAAAPAAGPGPVVFEAVRYGAVPDGRLDATDPLRRAFRAALSDPAPDVVVELGSGTYRLDCPGVVDAACLAVDGSETKPPKRLTIRGSGRDATVLSFRNVRAGAFRLSGLEAAALQSLSITYDPLPFLQGVVTAIATEGGRSRLTIRAQPGFLPDRSWCEGPDAMRAGNWGLAFSPAGRGGRRGLPGGHANPLSCRVLDSVTWELAFRAPDVATLRVNDSFVRLLGRDHRKSAAWFHANGEARIDAVAIRSSPGLATLFTQTARRIEVERLEVAPAPGSPALISTNGDGVHMQQNWAAATIAESRFVAMADDAINIYAKGYMVSAADGETVELAQRGAFRPGDPVSLVGSVSGRLLGAGTIVQVNPDRAGRGTSLLLSPGTATAAGLAAAGDPIVLFDDAASAPGSVIARNVFEGNRGRGILIRSRSALISDNVFRDVDWAAVSLLPTFAAGGDLEGPYPADIVIRGNRISGGSLTWGSLVSGCATSSHRPGEALRNIEISNNNFDVRIGRAVNVC